VFKKRLLRKTFVRFPLQTRTYVWISSEFLSSSVVENFATVQSPVQGTLTKTNSEVQQTKFVKYKL